MTSRIGLLSDIHATVGPLRDALELFRREHVDTILCAGDIAGYGNQLAETVRLLSSSGCRSILGNHDLWHLECVEGSSFYGPTEAYLRSLYGKLELNCAGKTVYMVHASPPHSLLQGIKLLDEEASVIEAQREKWQTALGPAPYDVLVVGHTHQVFAEQLGDLLVINPGSTLFNHTCAILTLPDLSVQFMPLGGKTPLLSWNWGMLDARANGATEG